MTENTQASHLYCLGVSHKTASVEQRERFACFAEAWPLDDMPDLPYGAEWALLSTCNRVELYLAIPDGARDALQMLDHRVSQFIGLSSVDYQDHRYLLGASHVASHLLSVAAGMDSMVVGESQILGQVTESYMLATERRTIGPTLTALFRAAMRAGKRVRSETRIGQNQASISSVALAFGEQCLGGLQRKKIVVIGLGDMGRLALKLLRSRGARNVSVVNRTLERAQRVADAGWRAYPLSDLCDVLADADLVLSATGAGYDVISTEMLAEAVERRVAVFAGSDRSQDPLVVIDMAMPRDVDPVAADLPGIHLIDLDHLKASMMDGTETSVRLAMADVQAILDEETVLLHQALRELTVRPVVADLRRRAETIRLQELQRTLKFMGEVDPETLAHLQHLTRALVNKLLHEPTVRIKERARQDEPEEYVSTVRDLFGLDAPAPSV